MKRYLLITLISFSFCFFGCEKSEWLTDGDYFFLKNKGAVMPIWVNGNKNSDVYILTVHGGPGATSGHEFPISTGFKLLEQDYNVIYWDQRMSGMSQGDPDRSTLTIDQHIEDLEKVIQLIKVKYNPGSLFLLGHSWGGVMTAGYLGKNNNQDLFNGWIDLDGSFKEEVDTEEMKKWILDRVPLYYNRDPEFYQFIIDWYAANPNPKNSNPYPYFYSSILGGYIYDYENSLAQSPVPYGTLAFKSPFTWAFYFSQYGGDAIKFADGYDVTEELNNITIPTLLLWGAEDGVVTANVGQIKYDLLATPIADKHFITLESCAHSPHYDQPDKFSLTIHSFIEQYK